MTTPVLGLVEIAEGVASQASLHNQALREFEARTSRVLSRALTTPPGSPAESDAYIIPAAATGVWSGKTNQIATFIGGAWSYYVPIEGCSSPWVNNEDKLVTFDGTNWVISGGASGGTVTNTGGALTANAVVLGAGTADAKVVAGITTDGTSKLTLGVAGTSIGSIDLKNATSGTITIQPATGALGTVTLTAPALTGTLARTADITGTNSGTNTGDQTSVSGNAGTATALQTARTIGGTSFDGTANITQPYDIGGSYTGVPTASVVLMRFTFPRTVIFAAGLGPSQAKSTNPAVAATAQTDFDIQKNGSSVGTMRWAAAGTVASFIMASQTTFNIGDVLALIGPATPDATLANLAYCLSGTR